MAEPHHYQYGAVEVRPGNWRHDHHHRHSRPPNPHIKGLDKRIHYGRASHPHKHVPGRSDLAPHHDVGAAVLKSGDKPADDNG